MFRWIFYTGILVGGKKICCVQIYFLTSEVTSLYMSDTLFMLAFSYIPLLLQSSVWFLINVSPHGSFCSPYNTSSMCKLYVYCFLQASVVIHHCLHFVFQEICAEIVFSCMQIHQVLFVCSLSHVIYICMLWVPMKAWKATCALLLTSQHENQIVLRIISGQALWCLFRITPLKMRMFMRITPIGCRTLRLTGNCNENQTFLWEKKLNTTEMSQCCLTDTFYWKIIRSLHCVLFKSYRMFVRTKRLHLAGETGELCCLRGGWVSTIFIH